MRRFEGHQQGQTKQDVAVFTESAAVKVSYIWPSQNTSSRHNRAIERNFGKIVFNRRREGNFEIYYMNDDWLGQPFGAGR
jgi:hypothetical protein